MTLPALAPPRRLAPLAGFGPLFAWGLRLTLGGRRFFLVAILALGFGALLGRFGVDDPRRVQELAEILDESVLKFLVPLAALTLVAQGYSREVQDRTLVYHLVRPVSRTTVFLARYAAGLIPAAVVTVLLLTALFVTARSGLAPASLLPVYGAALLGVVAIGAIYYVLSALLRHGLVASLIYTFVFEALVGATRGSIQKLSVMFHVRSLHHRLTDEAFGVETAREVQDVPGFLGPAEQIAYDEPVEAVLWLVGIAVVVLAFGAWRTRRRDFALKD